MPKKTKDKQARKAAVASSRLQQMYPPPPPPQPQPNSPHRLATWNMQGGNKWVQLITMLNNLDAHHGHLVAICLQECGHINLGGSFLEITGAPAGCELFRVTVNQTQFNILKTTFHDCYQGQMAIVYPTYLTIRSCGARAAIASTFDTQMMIGRKALGDPNYLPGSQRIKFQTELAARFSYQPILGTRGILYANLRFPDGREILVSCLHALSLGSGAEHQCIANAAWCTDNVNELLVSLNYTGRWVCMGDFNFGPQYFDGASLASVSSGRMTQLSGGALDYLITRTADKGRFVIDNSVNSAFSDHFSQTFTCSI